MSTATIDGLGSIHLPDEVCQRRGLLPNTRVRILETRHGVMIIPITEEPVPTELADELAAWQAAGIAGWDQFPYEESSS